MAKKSKTIRLSDKAINILKELSEKQDRSEGYIVDKLILATKIVVKLKNKE